MIFTVAVQQHRLMFNIQPGQGLGFTASKEIALGLGAAFAFIGLVKKEVIRLLSYITRILNLGSEI